MIQHVFQGTSHVQARRDALHRQHPRAVGAAPHAAKMHVAVDDAGLQNKPREVHDFLRVAREIAANSGNLAVYHGNIGNAVHTVQGIHHVGALDEKIKHPFLLDVCDCLRGIEAPLAPSL